MVKQLDVNFINWVCYKMERKLDIAYTMLLPYSLMYPITVTY